MVKTDINDKSSKFLGISKVLLPFCEIFFKDSSAINKVDMEEYEVCMGK